MPAGSAFPQMWSDERLRETFLSYVPRDELKSCRLVCKDFAARAAPVLFREKKITFRKNIFTSPAWLAMLDRLGPYVKIFHFDMPHSKNTSLPPLIDDQGDAVTFVYDPYTGSNKKPYDFVPPYGSPELYDLLTKHYPTLFHAAANVSSFIRVFASLTNIEHLKISCPGQDRSEAYMRSAVDYALISLRIAVERNRLLKLDTLSLLSVHPMAPFYLNPLSGFGARPNSPKRWSQIKNLTVHIDTPPTSTPADHLKLLHNYLHLFAPHLEDLSFRWQGLSAPWPLTLHNEPPPQNVRSAIIYATQSHLSLRALHLPRLRSSTAQNITTDASQISAFVTTHHHMPRLYERCSIDFQKSHLRSGTWEDALAPFSRISGAEKWDRALRKAKKESMERMNAQAQAKAGLPASPPKSPELELLKPVAFDPAAPHRAVLKQHPKLPHLGLQKAGAVTREILLGTEARTLELLQGTEGRVREMFRASVFSCWGRRSPSVASSRRSGAGGCYGLPSCKYEGGMGMGRGSEYLLPATRYEGSIVGRVSRCA